MADGLDVLMWLLWWPVLVLCAPAGLMLFAVGLQALEQRLLGDHVGVHQRPREHTADHADPEAMNERVMTAAGQGGRVVCVAGLPLWLSGAPPERGSRHDERDTVASYVELRGRRR